MTEVKLSSRKGLFITAGALVLMMLLYVGGALLLPAAINSTYQGKNCGLALQLDKMYRGLYPEVLLDKNTVSPVKECAIYSLATAAEDAKSWQNSYDAYQVYAGLYPQGLFSGDAHEHAATALVGLANEQLAGEQYASAIGSLDLLSHKYADTPAMVQTASLLSAGYTAWAVQLRNAGDFAGAEKVLNNFKTSAQTAQKKDQVEAAQLGLAQTYVAWGQALQSQNKFQEAKERFELVMSLDPDPSSSAGPSAQAKTAQSRLYGAWGDYLVGQQDFSAAIDRYQTGVVLSVSADQPIAKDMVANGYVKWAASLADGEDFLGALKQIDLAAQNAAGPVVLKSIEAAKKDTFVGFSASTGKQAQQAMADAIKSLCDAKIPTDLPIFGLDEKNILAGVYGVPGALPANVAATMPGNLHYVACITVSTKVMETRTLKVYRRDTPAGANIPMGTRSFVRDQAVWDILLLRIDTGEVVAHNVLNGALPGPFALTSATYVNVDNIPLQSVHGDNPDMVDLGSWLRTVMK